MPGSFNARGNAGIFKRMCGILAPQEAMAIYTYVQRADVTGSLKFRGQVR